MKLALRLDLPAAVPFMSTLMPVLLDAAVSDAAVSLRLLALDCMLLMLDFPYSSLYPVKSNVVKVLGKAIDDPKRSVLQLASKVRNEWIVLSNK